MLGGTNSWVTCAWRIFKGGVWDKEISEINMQSTSRERFRKKSGKMVQFRTFMDNEHSDVIENRFHYCLFLVTDSIYFFIMGVGFLLV